MVSLSRLKPYRSLAADTSRDQIQIIDSDWIVFVKWGLKSNLTIGFGFEGFKNLPIDLKLIHLICDGVYICCHCSNIVLSRACTLYLFALQKKWKFPLIVSEKNRLQIVLIPVFRHRRCIICAKEINVWICLLMWLLHSVLSVI